MIANCYGGSNVLHMLILHSKCSIDVPTSCVQPGTCRNIWNVLNLLLAGKWQVLSTRAYNVLKMFSLVSRPPCPQCHRFRTRLLNFRRRRRRRFFLEPLPFGRSKLVPIRNPFELEEALIDHLLGVVGNYGRRLYQHRLADVEMTPLPKSEISNRQFDNRKRTHQPSQEMVLPYLRIGVVL